MPHTIHTLVSSRNLSENEVTATLAAAGLPLDVKEYSDEDITQKFDVVRGFFLDGRVKEGDYQTAQELFATLTQVKSTRKPKTQKLPTPAAFVSPAGQAKGDPQPEQLSITDLLNLVKNDLNLTLNLKQVVVILETIGLADKEYYTQTEANRFLIACNVIATREETDISSQIQNLATAMETGLIRLVDGVTSQRAKEVPALVKQIYLQNVVMSLVENQEDIEDFFNQIKDSIVAGIEGKSPLRSVVQGQWISTPSSELTPSLNQLPAISDSQTRNGLKKE
jgi:hypothetical protein